MNSATTTVVHLSDLHLGGGYFVSQWGDLVVETVNAIKPNLLVITGDLTTEGYVHEYEQVVTYLNRFTTRNRIIVPGNHDSRNEGYMIFEELFGPRYPFYEDKRVVILGVDSSQPDIDDGHIGRANYPLITKYLNDPSAPKSGNIYNDYKRMPESGSTGHSRIGSPFITFPSGLRAGPSRIKIMALHHHLIPIPGTGRERHIPTDAGDVLKLAIDLDIRIVLSGHKHLPWVWQLERSWFITSGTATSQRLKGRSYPSFHTLVIGEDDFTLTEINVLTGASQKKLRVSLL